jgi:hypothetical protein
MAENGKELLANVTQMMKEASDEVTIMGLKFYVVPAKMMDDVIELASRPQDTTPLTEEKNK